MIGDKDSCIICGTTLNLETHHCIGGSYKKKSDDLGMVVRVCSNCHTQDPDSIHRDPRARYKKLLQKLGQVWAMEHYGWTVDEFREKVGKNFFLTKVIAW